MKVLVSFIPALDELQGSRNLDTPPLSIYLIKSFLSQIDSLTCNVIDPMEYVISVSVRKSNNTEQVIGNVLRVIKSHIDDIDVFVFSSNTFNWAITKHVIDHIKDNYPEKIVIAGGLHPTRFYKHIMETTNIDYIAPGENLEGLKEILHNISGKNKFSNRVITQKNYLLYKKPNKNQNAGYQSIVPDYSSLSYRYGYSSIPIQGSVGCENSCSFCSIMGKGNWREIDTTRVVDVVKKVTHDYGKKFAMKSILFTDDCFTTVGDRAIKIIEACNSCIPGYQYFIEARVNDIVETKFVDTISPDVISGIQIGVECGYNDGLKKIGKKTTIEKLIECCQKLRTYNFHEKTMISFIIGFPWESQDDIGKTLDTVERVSEEFGIFCNINYLILLPSNIWEKRRQYNIRIHEKEYDDLMCFFRKDFFDQSHPMLNNEVKGYVKKRVTEMLNRGLKVSIQSDHLDLYRDEVNINVDVM